MPKFYINAKSKTRPVKFFYVIVTAQDHYEASEKFRVRYPDLITGYKPQEITAEIP